MNVSGKDEFFIEAIETLQLLSTLFTPRDKISLIQKTIIKINVVSLFFICFILTI